jgi:hypothetical protein
MFARQNPQYNPLIMRLIPQFALGVVILTSSYAGAQSLGDVARQQRFVRKPTGVKVITNDDFQAQPESLPVADMAFDSTIARSPEEKKQSTGKPSAEAVKLKVRAQKQKIHELEAHIKNDQKRLDYLKGIPSNVTVYQQAHLSGANTGWCSAPSALYSRPDIQELCAEPAKLQQDIDATQSQLKQELDALEQMQEEARRMGYGSSVYDAD